MLQTVVLKLEPFWSYFLLNLKLGYILTHKVNTVFSKSPNSPHFKVSSLDPLKFILRSLKSVRIPKSQEYLKPLLKCRQFLKLLKVLKYLLNYAKISKSFWVA